jgi:hypothetical protein
VRVQGHAVERNLQQFAAISLVVKDERGWQPDTPCWIESLVAISSRKTKCESNCRQKDSAQRSNRAVGLTQLARDEQAKPDTLRARGVKRIEQLRLQLRRNAGAAINDVQIRRGAVLRLKKPARTTAGAPAASQPYFKALKHRVQTP